MAQIRHLRRLTLNYAEASLMDN